MKITKKIISLSMVVALAIPCFSGCGPNNEIIDNNGVKVDPNTTTMLDVVVYDGGLGTDWAQNAANKFREKYINYSFETGKTGVYVNIIPQKEQIEEGNLLGGLQAGTQTSDIYYTSMAALDKLNDAGYAMDITDAMFEDCYDENGELVAEETTGTKSIADKLNPIYLDDWKVTVANKANRYVALPYESNLYGFVYNYDLFKSNNLLHYSGLDGTPKTTDEFVQLLDELQTIGYKGFTHQPHDAPYYTHNFNYTFLRQYEGKEAAQLNYTFDGEYKFEGDSQVTKITAENAYLLAKQSGKKALFEFLDDINQEAYCDSGISNPTVHTYTQAQANFVMSESRYAKEKIAMLYEGDYWEKEARTSFDSLEDYDSTKGYGKIEYRVMPVPQADGGKNDEGYMFSLGGNTLMFANAKSESKREAIEKWLQYTLSDSALNDYITYTGMTPAFDFELTETTKNKITPYANYCYKIKTQNYVDEKTNQKVEITLDNLTIRDENRHVFYNNYMSMTGYGKAINVSAAGKQGTQAIWKFFYNNPDVTAETIWTNYVNAYTSESAISQWNTKYNQYKLDFNITE